MPATPDPARRFGASIEVLSAEPEYHQDVNGRLGVAVAIPVMEPGRFAAKPQFAQRSQRERPVLRVAPTDQGPHHQGLYEHGSGERYHEHGAQRTHCQPSHAMPFHRLTMEIYRVSIDWPSRVGGWVPVSRMAGRRRPPELASGAAGESPRSSSRPGAWVPGAARPGREMALPARSDQAKYCSQGPRNRRGAHFGGLIRVSARPRT